MTGPEPRLGCRKVARIQEREWAWDGDSMVDTEAGSIHFTRGWQRAIDLTAKRLFAGHVIHDDCPRRPPKIALCHRLESLQGHGAIRRGHAHIHNLWVVKLVDITRVQGRKPISLGVVWECRDTHLLPRRVPDLQLDSFSTNLSKKVDLRADCKWSHAWSRRITHHHLRRCHVAEAPPKTWGACVIQN